MAKVHIIGGPGSGKTTLARSLSSRFHIPHYDLDLIGQKNGTNAEAHVASAFSIAKQSGWITEGIYLITPDPLLYEADYIVLLEVSWPFAAWRIIKRHITRTLHGTNQYPGLKRLFNFLGDSRRYYLNKRRELAEIMRLCLKEHQEMPLPPTPDVMVRYLETYHEVSIPPTTEFVHQYLETYQGKVLLLKNNADREHLFELLANM